MEPLVIKNIRIIHLRGTREERAQKHGEIIASLTPEERYGLAYTPLSKKNQHLIKKAGARIPGIGKLIGGLYEAFVLERFLRLPKEFRNRLEPFAKAAKISRKRIWLSLYQPDMLMVLAASANPKTRNRFLQGLPGCSTVRIFTTEGTKFIRTLDYPAAAYWERNPAVYYHEPTDPGLQKYISVSSLGLPTAGLTGWNESGIAFSLHAHFSKKVSLRGVPIFFLGESILESAKTLQEAIELCRRFKPIGSWALNISSFKENKSVTVELVNGKIYVRAPDLDAGIAHANLFQSPEFQKSELHFSGDFFEDCGARKKSLESIATDLKQNFSWNEAFKRIASHIDPETSQIRIFGNTLSVVTTIQSVGFDPEAQCLYLSTRNETPVTHGPYLKLPFHLDDLKPSETQETITIDNGHSETFFKALHHYYQAYVAWQVRGEDAKIPHSYLIEASETEPEDPHLQMQRGYFELIDGQTAGALQCFEKALSGELSAHHYQVALYFRGACQDLLGQRELARKDYQMILAFKQVDEKLGIKAKKRLNRPFKAAYCKRIEPDLQFVEPINYP